MDIRESTTILKKARAGDAGAAEQLIPLLYDELHAVAVRFFRKERTDHTLQPTALVHEAYLRLVDQDGVEAQDRAHFLALAARLMRQILIDHARHRRSQKQGGMRVRVPLNDVYPVSDEDAADLLALQDALAALEELDERKARVVELRFFSGLTAEETAEVLGVSLGTVERDWRFSRAWLQRELSRGVK